MFRDVDPVTSVRVVSYDEFFGGRPTGGPSIDAGKYRQTLQAVGALSAELAPRMNKGGTVEPAPGIKVSSISSLDKDIARGLSVKSVRVVDVIPGGFVCSARLKCPADNGAIREVVSGQRAIRKLFTKKQREIYARRYFYPLISEFPMYRALPSAAHSNLPVAVAASSRVICLPIFPAHSCRR